MIRAIIFDCFGVLTTETWLLFIGSLPDAVDVDAVREAHRAYTAGFISKQECADEIHQLTGQYFEESEDLEPNEISKNTVLLDYIGELRDRGYKIGLLSNIATNWVRDTLLTLEEQALFDDMVMSFEVGMVKPDERIFRLACERLGVEPAETVFVDDIDRYCVAAEAEGMKSVVYKEFKQMKSELEGVLAKNS